MTPGGDRAGTVPAEARAFMRAAERFARPASALSFLVEELEVLPDLEPLLPLLTFSLFADALQVPATAVPGRPEDEFPRRPSAATWPTTGQSARPRSRGHLVREPERAAHAPYESRAPGEAAIFAPWRDESREKERSTHNHADTQPAPEPRRQAPNRGQSHGQDTPSARFQGSAIAANGHEPPGRGDPQHRHTGEGRALEPDASAATGMPWLEKHGELGQPAPWAWPDADGRSASHDDSAPALPGPRGWEALALVDTLADDLLAQRAAQSRPAAIDEPSRPGVPHLGWPAEASAPAPGPARATIDMEPEPSWTDDTELAGAVTLEADDVAAMVAEVLFAQARRHGVDLS